MQRAVRRGLERREEHAPKRIGVDETSFQKRHEGVTVVTDLDTRDVLYVADDRTKESLDRLFELCEPGDLLDIEVVSMDMWPAYISTTNDWIPDAGSKICFDNFHVAQYLGNAVDKLRRQEQKQLVSEGNNALVRSKYKWLRNPESPLAEPPGYFERVKRMACGFRNRERFRTAICFHLGGLDLLPSSHTKP